MALRLHALHTVAVQGQARGKEARPSFLSPVARAKFNAVKALRNEGKELGEIRQELVDIVQHNFPEWRQVTMTAQRRAYERTKHRSSKPSRSLPAGS